MKITFLFLLLLLSSTLIFGQSSYIQVNGEPDLSVYLNNQFKGKTTSEYNGLIIENVTDGKNLIKIIKTGYTPFEEYITVKAGEVFAYKVKSFTKHIVQISEQGNTAVSEEKATIETGKLIIQSLPIEIKITMPDIEGIMNSPKTKDEWLADKIPAGNYNITFTYNQKVITKNVEIDGDNTTSVFVNMLNGEYTVKRTLFQTKQLENEILLVKNIIDSLCKVYKFKRGLSENEFRNYNTEAKQLIPLGGAAYGTGRGKPRNDKTPGAHTYYFEMYRPVTRFEYILLGEPHANTKMLAFYNEQLNYYKRRIPAKYLHLSTNNNMFTISEPSGDLAVHFCWIKSGSDKHDKYSYVDISFFDHKTYPKEQ